MKRVALILMTSSLFLTLSCDKHEIVPAPTPKVDLYCHFMGNINNSDIEYTQNVDGYDCETTKAKTILPAGNQSFAIYYSTIRSEQLTPYIKLGLGNLYYDATSTENPPLAQFNSFFSGNLVPPYKMNGDGGFLVEYRDGAGRIWQSTDTTTNMQDVLFSEIRQESDESGDYSKFKCEFNCWVYRLQDPLDPTSTDSLEIKDAVFEGWYKR